MKEIKLKSLSEGTYSIEELIEELKSIKREYKNEYTNLMANITKEYGYYDGCYALIEIYGTPKSKK